MGVHAGAISSSQKVGKQTHASQQVKRRAIEVEINVKPWRNHKSFDTHLSGGIPDLSVDVFELFIVLGNAICLEPIFVETRCVCI